MPKRLTFPAILTALACVAAVAVVALFTAGVLRPPSIPREAEVTTARVTTQDFFDERPVSLNVSEGRKTTLWASRAGIVTSSVCDTQATSVASGTVPLSVDGTPVLALHTSVPLWRDLSYGDRGPDVDALKAELERLGSETSPGDQYLWAEAQSLSLLRTSTGVTEEDADFVAKNILWLPSQKVSLAKCSLATGDAVEAGRTVFAEGQGAPAVAITPAEAVTGGKRVLEVDGTKLPLADGQPRLTDEALAALMKTAAFTAAQQAADKEGKDASFKVAALSKLATPKVGALVPPAALTLSGEGHGCVQASGKVLDVTVADSRLGQTVVLFEDGQKAPTEVSVKGPKQCA